MPFKSKFTERFDIDPSITGTTPPSPAKLSMVYSASSKSESNPNVNSHNVSDPNISTTSIDTSISQKRTSMPVSPVSPPHHQNDKHHDALASKFKHFLKTIKRKERSLTVATPLARAVSTKY
jgi:hypothetical protein